jgi:hypothetical protein
MEYATVKMVTLGYNVKQVWYIQIGTGNGVIKNVDILDIWCLPQTGNNERCKIKFAAGSESVGNTHERLLLIYLCLPSLGFITTTWLSQRQKENSLDYHVASSF